ncbi:hypothetical protein IAS59_002503 [Cryptococcus gattii]
MMIAPHLHLQQAHITQTLEETNTYGIAYRDTKGPLSLTQLPEPQLLPKLKTIHPQPTTSALGLGRKIRRRLRTAGKTAISVNPEHRPNSVRFHSHLTAPPPFGHPSKRPRLRTPGWHRPPFRVVIPPILSQYHRLRLHRFLSPFPIPPSPLFPAL